MRELTRSCLEGSGYAILDAANGESAVRTATGHDAQIHLLVTDVVMTGISGPSLAKSLLASRPQMKVLFMSGYTSELVAERSVLDRDISLLEKPFTREALLRKVRATLDGDLVRCKMVGQ